MTHDNETHPVNEMEDAMTDLALKEHFAPASASAPDLRARIFTAIDATPTGTVRPLPLTRWAIAAGLLALVGLVVALMATSGGGTEQENASPVAGVPGDNSVKPEEAPKADPKAGGMHDWSGAPRQVKAKDAEEAKRLIGDAIQVRMLEVGSNYAEYAKDGQPLNAAPFITLGAEEQKTLCNLLTADLKELESGAWLAPNYHVHFDQADGTTLQVTLESDVFRVAGIAMDCYAPKEAFAIAEKHHAKALAQAKLAYGIVESEADIDALPEDTGTIVVTPAAFGKSMAGATEGQSLSHLNKFTGIKHLTLEGAIRDEGLHHLEMHTKLESLSLVRNDITGEGLEVLAKLKNLKRLKLYEVRHLKPEGFANIATAPALEDFHLEPYAFRAPKDCYDDSHFVHLSKMTKLRKLTLKMAGKLTGSGLEGLIVLESATFDGTCLSDRALMDLMKACKVHSKLKTLHLDHQLLLTRDGYLKAFELGVQGLLEDDDSIEGRNPEYPIILENLTLCNSPNFRLRDFVSSRALWRLTLKTLILNSANIGEKDILELGLHRRLAWLSLASTQLNDDCAASILTIGRRSLTSSADKPSPLRELDFSDCQKITDKFVEAMASLEELQSINFTACKHITEAACRELAKALPKCAICMPSGEWLNRGE